MTASRGTPEDPRLKGLPASSFDTVRMLTRAPFTPQAVRWKVQAQWSTGGLIVAVVIMVVAAVKGQAIKDERKRARKRREMQDYLIEREYKRERRRQSAPWN